MNQLVSDQRLECYILMSLQMNSMSSIKMVWDMSKGSLRDAMWVAAVVQQNIVCY